MFKPLALSIILVTSPAPDKSVVLPQWAGWLAGTAAAVVVSYAVTDWLNKKQMGDKAIVRSDIAAGTAELEDQLKAINDKYLALEKQQIITLTQFEERYEAQQKENARIRQFTKTEVGNLGDRLDGKFEFKIEQLREDNLDTKRMLKQTLDSQAQMVTEMHDMGTTLKLVAQSLQFLEKQYQAVLDSKKSP